MRSSPRWSLLAGSLVLLACGDAGPLEPVGGTFEVGQSLAVESGREARVLGGPNGGFFTLVLANIAGDTLSSTAFSLRTSGIGAGIAEPFASRSPLAPDGRGAGAVPVLRDDALEEGLRDRERAVLSPRIDAARRWYASRVPALPASPSLGDLITINVNAAVPCSSPVYHAVRVVAIGSKALVLEDTLNPKPGFTASDFARFAARFDTLVYPLDVAAYGTPTDIDGNGRIAIVFTLAVNELTPPNAPSYVGGLTFSRDLFPQVATARAQACPASNEGELFYMMTPDPYGVVNGNRRSAGFVDTVATSVLAHELEHLINASRKLYVNTGAPRFEEKWLDEGLAHIAEELLFYRESGLASRSNLDYATLAETNRTRGAYRADMASNAARYKEYLLATASSSPYRGGDLLATRGAAWSLLRYLADRTRSSDGDVWARLVDNSATGMANLQAVFGKTVPAMVRDWAGSHELDDRGVPSAAFQQPSWNWHSIYGGVDGLLAMYPLHPTPLDASTLATTGSLVAGGADFYTFSVPANDTATITLGAASGAAASNLQFLIVRTQ
ncbi:MAG TPA: hypothetical protein VFP90_10930 [Gemmatimonadaceae bacterium]|nr:hypothetical protein [Gemmatimonadaceae bacterium]